MIESIKHIFIEETSRDLHQLNSELQELSFENISNEVVEKIFRTMHTIKGSAPMFGYNNIAEIAVPVAEAYRDVCRGRMILDNQIIEKTKNIVLLIQDELNNGDGRLPASDEEKQMLVDFFANINRLNNRAND